MQRFLFVGERPSPRAEQTCPERSRRIGATWQNGKLAARTLHEALRTAGIQPDQQAYANLWLRSRACKRDDAHRRAILATLRRSIQQGIPVVGLGQVVCRVLRQHGIPHIPLIHPAARGPIRTRAAYHAHVRERLAAVGKQDGASLSSAPSERRQARP